MNGKIVLAYTVGSGFIGLAYWNAALGVGLAILIVTTYYVWTQAVAHGPQHG